MNPIAYIKEKKNEANFYYLGMFDLLKGICMISIIITHTKVFFPETAFDTASGGFISDILKIIFQIISMGDAVMPIFLIISGYGFRVLKSNKKCIEKQAKALLKPYLYAAVISTGLHVLVHYYKFRYLRGSVQATIPVLLGFLLGAGSTTTIHGVEIYGVGPMWFLVTLFVSWVLLNILFNLLPEKFVGPVVLIISYAGYLIAQKVWIPFCLLQSCVGMLFIYIGYVIKKGDWYRRKIPFLLWAVLIPLSLFCIVKGGFVMYSLYLPYGFIGAIAAGALAFLIIRLFLNLNWLEFFGRSSICMIGRQSLIVMCIHNIEYHALLWYTVAERHMDYPFDGLLLILGLRSIFIYLVYQFLLWYNAKFNKKKRRGKRYVSK